MSAVVSPVPQASIQLHILSSDLPPPSRPLYPWQNTEQRLLLQPRGHHSLRQWLVPYGLGQLLQLVRCLRDVLWCGVLQHVREVLLQVLGQVVASHAAAMPIENSKHREGGVTCKHCESWWPPAQLATWVALTTSELLTICCNYTRQRLAAKALFPPFLPPRVNEPSAT